jgi:hypothetical protein
MRISHLIENAKVDSNGLIEGTLVLIPGTPGGDQALAIAAVGGKLGVSSRGFGTTVPDAKGKQIVQEDYMLVTWDIVADPANSGAFPNMVIESKEFGKMDIEELKKQYPQLIESLEADVRKKVEKEARDHARSALTESFEEKLVETTDKVKAKALKEAEKKLRKDPEVAGAVEAMSSIVEAVAPYVLGEDERSVVGDLTRRLQEAEERVAKLDGELSEVTTERDELSEYVTEAYFHLYLERALGGDPRREQIESMVGDVTDFESLEELKERVEDVQDALHEEDERQNAMEEQVRHLEAEKALLEDKLTQALNAGNQFAVRAYVEKSIAKHPRAMQLRRKLSEATTKKQVDEMIVEFDEQNPVSDEYKDIRKGLGLDGNDKGGRQKVLTEDNQVVEGLGMEELAEIKIQ